MGSNKPAHRKTFCEVCNHTVHNMKAHIQTEEHKRNLRRQTGETTGHSPRVPINVGIAEITKEEGL